MWNRSAKSKGCPRKPFSILAYLLVGLLAVKQSAQGRVAPQEPPLPVAKPRVSTLTQAAPKPIKLIITTTLAGEYARVDSDFYLTRTSGLDRAFSVALSIASIGLIPSREITTFVTFLPGQKAHLVAITPIIDQIFAPESEVFVRILPPVNRAAKEVAHH